MTIVVDQLAAWMADERWSALPADGGFARLRREGLTVRDLRYAHAITETSPGHAALYTGASPRQSGIVSNDVRAASGHKLSSLTDSGTRIVAPGPGGPRDRPSSSLATLQVETLADVLRSEHPGAQIYSFSLKDRGALFGGGRQPTLSLWLDTDGGTLITSTALTGAIPPWAWPLSDAAAVAAAVAWRWEPFDRAWVAKHATTADEQEGEGGYQGLGAAFPHRASSVKGMRATPAGDGLVFALAHAAATRAAAEARGAPVLLALSLSSHDYVNHVFGPDSWESWDELRRLDQRLADLLETLDRMVGPSGYAVLLTGDHGSTPLPEISRQGLSRWCPGGGRSAPQHDHWQRPCRRGARLTAEEITRAIDPEGVLVAGFVDPLAYLTARGRALSEGDREALRRRILDRLSERGSRSGEIVDVVDVRTAPETCPSSSDESLPALICRSIRRDQPGDFYLVPAPGTVFDPELAVGRGTNHGSPYLYDRAVPLLIRAPGRVPAGVVRTEPTSYAAFTRTAASLLRIREPAGVTGTGAPDLTTAR